MRKDKSPGAGFFATTIFLSAFLLFQVQPILGKHILPWFGGTSQVWIICLLVYQSLLLIGYIYAYAVNRLSPPKQLSLHLAILSMSVILIIYRLFSWGPPILPGLEWLEITDTSPGIHIASVLILNIGIFFILLSSTSALLQAWFARANPGQQPYTFYAVSNIGSLLALVTYPFLFEPLLSLSTQAYTWTACYILFVVFCTLCAINTLKPGAPAAEANTLPVTPESTSPAPPKPSLFKHLYWMFMSIFSAIMLMATTNIMTMDVAPVPLLWVLPLGIYLLSFVFCFRERTVSDSDRWIPVMLIFALASWYCLEKSMDINFFIQAAVFTYALFCCCMLSHGELYRTRPAPNHLTSFYLMIALGGVIGGISVALIAPEIFKGLWEFHFILMIYSLFAACLMATKRQKWMKPLWLPLSLMSLLTVILLCSNIRNEQWATISMSRNFYGPLSIHRDVVMETEVYSLFHGLTPHGAQFSSGPYNRKPTEYFNEDSGVGLAFLNHPNRLAGNPIRIGAIGLGIGTIAAYGHTNDYFRFYEINPEIIRIANDQRYFTYLSGCPAKIEIIPGDARISLEKEIMHREPQRFDILVVDAFNSDAIPVHLLTKEAFDTYLYHMADEGVIAFHISNAYLNLTPVVISAARHFRLDYAAIRTRGDGITSQMSTWILLTYNRNFTQRHNIKAAITARLQEQPPLPLWRDDFSNLLSVMKRPWDP